MRLPRLAATMVAIATLAAACSAATESAPNPPSPDAGVAAAAPEAAASSSTSAAAATPSYAGDVPAPEFPSGLDWLNTAVPLTMAELRGKVVLLDFWTYGCINCIHIIPDLERLEAEYPEELVVIGVHSAKFVNESATENIRNIVLRYDIQHPVVNDRDFEVWRAWGAQAWPTTVLVDPAGNVVGGHAGEGVYDIVAPIIEGLVQEFDADGRLDRTPLEFRLEKEGLPASILTYPGKVHVATGDRRLFVADSGRHRIVVADRATGDVLAVYGSGAPGFADGSGSAAKFDSPQGMELSADGTTLYVADTNNHAVRAVDTATGTVTTLLGTGRLGWPPQGGLAPDLDLNSPWDLERRGDQLYIAMAGHHQIWVMDLSTGVALPRVGNAREGVRNGALDEAELAQPSELAIDTSGRLYFADSESSSLRYADVAEPDGATGLVAGGATTLFEFGDVDGVAAEARFQHPLGVVVWNDRLIVADTYNSRLRLVDPTTQAVTTLLGSAPGWADGSDPRFYEPGGLTIDGDTLYVADTNNHAVRIVDLRTGETETIVLKGIAAFEPRPEDADYRGSVVTLAPLELGAGDGELLLDVTLPRGYKVNDEAPSSLTVDVTGSSVVIEPATIDLTGTKLPQRLAVDLSAGTADLTADLVLVYCREDAQSLCLIEQVRFRAEIAVSDGAGSRVVALRHGITAP